jgi:branched-chain amino acid transport system ATP-binding protein
VCTIPEGRGIFPNLTVDENLWVATNVSDAERGAVRDRAFTSFPPLGQRQHQLAGTLSGGEQQMLAMSRALTANPDVLLLDEISMGLAPVVAAELFTLVRQIADSGIPVLLVEQFARTALEIADTVAVMSQGRIRVTGSPDEVRDRVLETYLHADTAHARQDPAPS